MHVITLLTFAIIEMILFGISVWFVVYGLRNWNDRKSAAVVLFGIGFLGIYVVVNALINIGLL